MSHECTCGAERLSSMGFDTRCICDDEAHRGFTRHELHEAFGRVSDPQDWKAPINTLIAPEDREIVSAAIEFFTATTPTFAPFRNSTTGQLHCSARGYRLGPAGDH